MMDDKSAQIALMEYYSKLDNCHDYQMLDKYIDIIQNVADNFYDPRFDKLLKYAQKRRTEEYNTLCMSVIDIDVITEQ